VSSASGRLCERGDVIHTITIRAERQMTHENQVDGEQGEGNETREGEDQMNELVEGGRG